MGLTFSKQSASGRQSQGYDQSNSGHNNHNRRSSIHNQSIAVDELSDDDTDIMFVRHKPMSTSSPQDLYGDSSTLGVGGGGHTLSTAAAAAKLAKQFPTMEPPIHVKRSVPPLIKSTISSRFNRVPALYPISKSQTAAASSTQSSLLMNGYGNVDKPIEINGFHSMPQQQSAKFQPNFSLRRNSVSRRYMYIVHAIPTLKK